MKQMGDNWGGGGKPVEIDQSCFETCGNVGLYVPLCEANCNYAVFIGEEALENFFSLVPIN